MSLTQEEILLTLVQGKDGEEWAASLHGWSLDETRAVPVCEWKGILCDADDRTVTAIELEESNLKATISDEMGQLNALRGLVLRKNRIYGSIPVSVANLPNLDLLDISDNQVTGTLPTFASKTLRDIVLGHNRLSGRLNVNFGHAHPSVVEFDVAANQLSGELPSSLGLMPKLNKLALSDNDFYGVIPISLGSSTSLQYLYLNENNFIGPIPGELSHPSSKLSELWLQGNSLSGSVPPSFSSFSSLADFRIHDNKLTGSIPDDLCQPEASRQSDANSGSGVMDHCSKIACPVNSVSPFGVWPCEVCPDGTINPYLGHQGCVTLDQEGILQQLWDATNGTEWTKDNNWFFDGVPMCNFTGISCNGDDDVVAIELPAFGLRGPVPDELGFLAELTRLDLSDNRLSGHLPSDLRFAPLKTLDLSGNLLTGLIPPLLCYGGDNGTGTGEDSACTNILCPTGTYSANGRASDESACLACNDGVRYLGAKTCLSTESSGPGLYGVIGLSVAGGALLFATVAFAYVRYFRDGRFGNRWKSQQVPNLDADAALVCHGPMVGEEGGRRAKVGSMASASSRSLNSAGSSNRTEKEVFSLVRQPGNEKEGWQFDWKAEKATENQVWLDVPRIS